MTYRGRIKNGVVVLEPGVRLREGMDVRVEPVGETEVAGRTVVVLRGDQGGAVRPREKP
jgi:hypothetical protein